MTLQGSRPMGWLERNKKRVGLVAVGYTAKTIEEFLFDTFLYGTVTVLCTMRFGTVWGAAATFAIMTPLSAILCLAYIRLYDWAKIDWLGLEALKELRTATGFWGGVLARILKYGDGAAFLALSIFKDPFITTIYLRRGSEYNGLTPRDQKIYWSSTIISNGYWTLRWTVIVEGFFWVMGQFN